MHIPTRRALNLKIFTQRVLSDCYDLLALWVEALKYLENDVSHVFDMGSPYLIELLDFGVCLASRHTSFYWRLSPNTIRTKGRAGDGKAPLGIPKHSQ